MNKAIPLTIFLSLLLVSIAGCSSRLDEDGFVVDQVVDGNTLLLDNGYQAVLLGITPTEEVQKELRDKYIGHTVYFVFDSSSDVPQSEENGQKFFAYALDESDGPCINGVLLKEGKCPLNESPNLVDSLNLYRTYAQAFQGNTTPEIVPPTTPADNESADDITIPAYNPDNDNFNQKAYWSDDKNANCALLKHVCDYNNSCTRDFSVQLAKRSEGNYNIGQVCEIFKYLYNKWRYVNDPTGSEYIARASESISQTHFSGDCDDFAVLMTSCVLAVGGNARINFAFNDKGGHAFCEVDISKMDESEVLSAIQDHFKIEQGIDQLFFRADATGKWLNLDWWASHPGGKYYQATQCDTYEFNGNVWNYMN